VIKFFRKIRQKLIMENKTTKYFKYAIGEILLVVIGILIALQINNWNETKQKENKLQSIYLEVQRELALNIKTLDRSIQFFEKQDSVIYLILNDKLTKQDYLKNSSLAYTLEYINLPNIQNKGYLSLNANLDILPKKMKPALEKLNNFYEYYLNYLNTGSKNFNAFMESYFEKLSDTKTWYVDYSYKFNYKNEEFLEYIVNDPFYKNKVYDYQIFMQNLFLSGCKIAAVEAYTALSEITGYKEDIDTSVYFQTAKDLEKFTGKFKIDIKNDTYNEEEKTDILTIKVKENQLIGNLSGKDFEIFPHKKNEFIFDGRDNAKITFLLNDANKVNGFQFFNQSTYTNWTKLNK